MATVGQASKKNASRLLNLALMLVFTAFSLGIADLVFRHYEATQLLPQKPEIEAVGPVNLATLSYNDGVVERQSGKDEFRILSFGDSFTYSVMEPALSYNGVLQQQLDEAVDGTRFRVINLGEPATGTRHFRAAHDFWSQVLEHDAVLFHIFLGNDVLDDAYMYSSVVWAPNDAVLKGGNPVLDAANARVPRKYPLRMLDYAYAYWMSARTRSKKELPEGYNWAGLTSFEPDVFERINFQYLENFDPGKLDDLLPGYEQVYLLLQRAAEIRESGRKVAVVLGPGEPQVDDALRASVLDANGISGDDLDMELSVRIIQRLRQRVAPEVPVLDLTPYFRQARQQDGESLFFRRNTHWDKAGNRLAGETIAAYLLGQWFNRPAPPALENEASYRNELLGPKQIDAYLEPITGADEEAALTVTGAVRSVHLFDGISGEPDNWAIAALNEPVLIRFPQARAVHALRLHLYDGDGRSYRFTVEAGSDGNWRTVADYSVNAVGGTVDIRVGGEPVSALKITGLYNSRQADDPDNAFLHIEEIELID